MVGQPLAFPARLHASRHEVADDFVCHTLKTIHRTMTLYLRAGWHEVADDFVCHT